MATLFITHLISTVWKSGGTADVVWYVGANHWGGYSYRLCNLAKIGGDRTKLTEDCFNGQLGKDFGGPLEFSGDKVLFKSYSMYSKFLYQTQARPYQINI